MLQTSSPKEDTTSRLSITIGNKQFVATYRCPEDLLRAIRLLVKNTQGMNAKDFWTVLEIANAGFKEEKGEAPKQKTS